MKRYLTCGPDDRLDAAFSNTQSSHDAVLVFEDDTFLGVISPVHALFRNRYSYGTKAKSCLVRPPKADKNTSLFRLAAFMQETGIYQVPVFRQDGVLLRVLGVHELFERALDDQQTAGALTLRVKPEAVHTAPEGILLRDADRRIRDTGTSGVLLVSASGQLRGIVTRHDIQQLLTKPSQRQRVKTGGDRFGGRVRNFVFGVEKKKRLDARAMDFATKDVLVAPTRTDARSLAERMRETGKNSVVLVDGNYRPTGIVTVGTLLQALASLQHEEEPDILVRDQAGLSPGDVEYVRQEAEKFVRKIARRSRPDRLEMTLAEARNPAGRPVEFEVKCEVLRTSGSDYFASGKDRDLMRAVRQALERIEKQTRREH